VKPLFLVATARHELHGAVRRYEESRPGLGEEFLAEVKRLLDRIASEASTFPKWRDDRPYRKAVMTHRFPFVIFFEIREEQIRVLAIAHGKRRPGYWLRRPPANR
jgi:toxin ParE1/3/4